MQSLVGSTKSRMKIRFVSTQHPPDICGNHGECTTATPASHCSREGAITTQPERPQSTKGKTSNKMVSSQRGIFQFLRSSASKAPQSRGGQRGVRRDTQHCLCQQHLPTSAQHNAKPRRLFSLCDVILSKELICAPSWREVLL